MKLGRLQDCEHKLGGQKRRKNGWGTYDQIKAMMANNREKKKESYELTEIKQWWWKKKEAKTKV